MFDQIPEHLRGLATSLVPQPTIQDVLGATEPAMQSILDRKNNKQAELSRVESELEAIETEEQQLSELRTHLSSQISG